MKGNRERLRTARIVNHCKISLVGNAEYFCFFIAVSVSLVCLGYSSCDAEVYKYVNKDGVVSYTDSLQAVPDRYRKNATVVKGLREKEETISDKSSTGSTTATTKQEGQQAQPQRKSIPVQQQIQQKVQDLRDKGYWKPVVIILALIAVFFLMGRASKAMGHKKVWTVLRILVVLGLMSYFFYAYVDEMSGVYSSLSKEVYSVKDRIGKKHADENKLLNEPGPDNKKQGEKR